MKHLPTCLQLPNCGCDLLGKTEEIDNQIDQEEEAFLAQYNEDMDREENDLVLAHEMGARIEAN